MTFRQRMPILALLCAITIFPPLAASEDPVHDKAFWATIVKNGYAVPDGADPFDLLDDLFRNLGSRDPVLRDDYGYGITWQWVGRQKLLPAEDSLVLVERLMEQLEHGIGEVGTDTVLMRSFSALNLSIFARHDLEDPFLEVEDFEAVLDAALTYLAEERDVRGRHEQYGWLHSTAHTADLLKFLARNRHLSVAGQRRILEAVAQKLGEAGEVLNHGEDERLADAVLALVARDDFDAAGLSALLDGLLATKNQRRQTLGFDEVRFVARQNGVHLLRTLFVKLSTADQLTPAAEDAKSRILKTLRTF